MTVPSTARSGPVATLAGLLEEGYRSLSMLAPDDPELKRVLDQVRLAFGPVWSAGPHLTLSVTREGLVCEGETVLATGEYPDGVASCLRSANVLLLVFTPGVEALEIVRFLDVLRRAESLGPEDEDDLSTLLWREDFNHLHYTVADPGDASDTLTLPRPPDADAVRAETIGEKVREDVAQVDQGSGIVKIEDFDSTLYFLERSEISDLRSAVEGDYAEDHAKNVLNLLLDTFELQSDTAVRDEVLGVLDSMLPHLLGNGNFPAAAYLISEAQALLQARQKPVPRHRTALDRLARSLSEPEALAQLFHILQDAETLPSAEDLASLLSHLRVEAMETLFLWLQRLTRQDARGVLISAVNQIFQENPRALSVVLGSEDPVVLLRALELVKGFKLVSALEPLAGLRSHPDLGIRSAVVSALASFQSSQAFRILTLMLDDPHAEVRIGVLQALIGRPFQPALGRLEEMIQDKDLESRDLSEKRVLFEAFGVLAGPSGTARLKILLRGRAGLGRRGPSSDTRACAAVALGRIGTPPAREALETALRDRDPVVRTAASRALRREDRVS